jgi:hypothetical protein
MDTIQVYQPFPALAAPQTRCRRWLNVTSRLARSKLGQKEWMTAKVDKRRKALL